MMRDGWDCACNEDVAQRQGVICGTDNDVVTMNVIDREELEDSPFMDGPERVDSVQNSMAKTITEMVIT